MDLRQQILFASERVESGLKYSSEQIQNQFLQTVITGLHDDTIWADLKPYLQDPKTKDEVLLEKMTSAYSLKVERKNKLATTSKTRTIKAAALSEENEKAELESYTHTKRNKTKQGETHKRDTLMEKVDQGNKAICEAIQSLTTQIAGLSQVPRRHTQGVSERPNRRYWPQPGAATTGRCQQCEMSDHEGKCSHCYKCGRTLGSRLSKENNRSHCK